LTSSHDQSLLVVGKEGQGPGEFNYPWFACFDRKNQQVHVTDCNNHRVESLSFSLDHSNKQYELKHASSFGSQGQGPSQFNVPTGICVQPATNHLIVADFYNHRLQVLTNHNNNNNNHHQHLFTIGGPRSGREDGQFNHPQGVRSTIRGDIIACDSGNHRVQVFDCKGHLIRKFGNSFICKPHSLFCCCLYC
jgi:DNA-binding beta-propeller fold protein YncE